jgi:MerR family transcriptional regulator, copper efflux regulator
MSEGQMQIGEVAARTALSLRTIRYYEEIDLVVPSGRTKGGFRLYTDADVERLLLVKAVKPLGLSLDETREMLRLRDRVLEAAEGPELEEARAALRAYLRDAEERLAALREDVRAAEDAVRLLRRDLKAPSARQVR